MELGTVGLQSCSALALAVLDTASVLGEGTSVALSSAPDESDYQTEFEEELPDISKETYADFQSTGIESDSDSVRCWALFCQCTSVVPTLRSPDRACPQTLPLQMMQPGTWQLLDIS